ncbi:MAG TPA: hypothetical protein VGG12_03410, partial [Methylovirgula sp.]
PPEVAGRQWDYLSGYNLSTFPRGYAPISFATLRGLADGYDLLRLVIETRKDQVARLSWTISPRDKRASNDPRLAALRRFFNRPDGRHGFADWLRMILEDLFVIDAPTLYMSRDRGGRLLGLLPIDGATIKPVIDDWGRTPLPYTQNGEAVFPVAYQQILKGYPAVDYSVRDLLYRPRNIRVDRAYVQTTWKENYDKLKRLLRVDVVAEPDLLLEPQYAAPAMFVAMEQGLYTSKKLADYFNTHEEDPLHARRIINGLDRAEEIASLYWSFKRALVGAELVA